MIWLVKKIAKTIIKVLKSSPQNNLEIVEGEAKHKEVTKERKRSPEKKWNGISKNNKSVTQ